MKKKNFKKIIHNLTNMIAFITVEHNFCSKTHKKITLNSTYVNAIVNHALDLIDPSWTNADIPALNRITRVGDNREITELRRRLKDAEDALEYAKGGITNDCAHDCRHFQECGDFKVCLCEQRINNAIAELAAE